MSVHSKILVHWTGHKQIERENISNKPQKYVELLENVLRNGLKLEPATQDAIRKWKIKNLRRVCFTEIKLTQSRKHSKQYGKLGIGFRRDFILEKGGRPVIYIPFEASKKSLEQYFVKAYEKSNFLKDSKDIKKSKLKDIAEINEQLMWLMAYFKRMSQTKDDYKYYEEMEWRIISENKSGERLTFKPTDIKIIIFPDEKTKQKAFENKFINDFFSMNIPNMVLLKDCNNF